MTTSPTQGEHAQTEALDDLYLKLHGMSKHLESSGRIDESDAPEAYPAILDAMNLVRRLQCESAQVAALTPTPECLTCNDHGAVGNILTAEPCPDCTPAQPAAPQGVAEVNWWEADGDKYDASISPMQPAQGVAYAELPKDVIRAVFIENGFTVKEGQTDLKQYVYDAAIELLRRARLRASNGQAPATKEAVGNSGFDHKTAADFLSGKTVSDEALRKFVAASRGAHDDRAALRAQMLSLRGELASREAEIALLKRSLLDAESVAPQPPTAQAAPSTQQAGEVVAYLDIGAGGYLDLGSALSDEALQQLPKGRHALVIAGAYGIDGYVAAPQPSPTAQAAPAAERQYINGVKTVADLVNNLLLLDQSLPIYAAQHIQIANRRRTITVPPTVSLERVKDERWIGEGDELNAAVIWTRAEAPAAGAVAWPWKDHQTREIVNQLRDCAKEFHATQQLRERLLDVLGPMIDWVRAVQAPTPAAQADSVLEDAAASEVLMEHSGCGSGTQVDMLTVRLNPGDKVIMLKGRITQAADAARKQGGTHDNH